MQITIEQQPPFTYAIMFENHQGKGELRAFKIEINKAEGKAWLSFWGFFQFMGKFHFNELHETYRGNFIFDCFYHVDEAIKDRLLELLNSIVITIPESKINQWGRFEYTLFF